MMPFHRDHSETLKKIAGKKVEALNSIEDARFKIERAVNADGEFSHNIISSTLRQVEQTFGKQEADKLIDEYDLTYLFGIKKVGVAEDIIEGSCPPGISKEVKDKVKDEYGKDNPKTYETLWSIKNKEGAKRGTCDDCDMDNVQVSKYVTTQQGESPVEMTMCNKCAEELASWLKLHGFKKTAETENDMLNKSNDGDDIVEGVKKRAWHNEEVKEVVAERSDVEFDDID